MNINRKLVCVLACRNSGARLYGKPLQNLDIENKWKIIDEIIKNISKCKVVDEIVLAIAEGDDNLGFLKYAKEFNLKYVIGNEIDVLSRLIKGVKLVDGTDLFRVTSESPFLYIPPIKKAWEIHKDNDNDATFLDEIIDGCGFEIIASRALEYSWKNGGNKHRSEMCSLFIRENKSIFKIHQIYCPKKLQRKDLRLTVDYPEDLIVCREVFKNVIKNNDIYSLNEIVKYLDQNPNLVNLIKPYCDQGYQTMYL